MPLHRYVRGTYNHFYTTNVDEIGTTALGYIGRYGFVYECHACKVYNSTENTPHPVVPLYRYLQRNGQHFYTTSWSEIGTDVAGVTVGSWICEGIAGYIYSTNYTNSVPLHRYYHPTGEGAHFYTTNIKEIGVTVVGMTDNFGYRYEGIAGYVIS